MLQAVRRIDNGSFPDNHNTMAQLTRTTSEETLVSEPESPSSPHHNGIPLRRTSTVRSDATVVDTLMGHAYSDFNQIRVLPVVSALFKKGLYVFPSEESFKLFKASTHSGNDMKNKGLGMPLLHCVVPILNPFKRNAPSMVFYRYKSSSVKYEFCNVYFKILKEGCVRYLLKFKPNGLDNDRANFSVVMFAYMKAPFTDTLYKNTRLRWTGTTDLNSCYGSGFFKMLILEDETPSLCDSVDSYLEDPRPTQECINEVFNNLSDSSSGSPPVARFSDRVKTSIPKNKKGAMRHGDVKVIEAFKEGDINSIDDIPESTLVITCMSMVLRDQEQCKIHGSMRFYDYRD